MNYKDYTPSPVKAFLKKTFIYDWVAPYMWRRDRKIERDSNEVIRGPLLSKYLPKSAIGAEIGVFKGDFSPTLLKHADPKELHLIDPWFHLEPAWEWASGNKSTVDALTGILQELKPEINKNRVFVHVQDDLIALRNFSDGYFDWVYLDSSHEYEHTKKELEILHNKVKKGGIIAGDDWRIDTTHPHYGVYKAIQEFLAVHDYEILYASETDLQWFLRKK